MKRKWLFIPVIILAVLILLLIPFVLKEKSHPALKGPRLSALKYSEIHFENKHAGIKLAGMLFLPEGMGPHPTAIIIHGSGTSRRNSKWYLSVAKHLQRYGIAVVLPDKRGSEKSEGKWLGAGFEELATDTLSAIDYVINQDTYASSTIGLLGMSQGGWIAPIVASQSDQISFVVSMSSATVTTNEQLLHEEVNNIAPYTYRFIAKLIAPISSSHLLKKESLAALAEFDPIPYWKNINVPVLIALGENDKNVPVEDSVQRLKENNLDHFNIKIYKNGGHAIRDPASNEVSQEYLDDLVQFIKAAQ